MGLTLGLNWAEGRGWDCGAGCPPAGGQSSVQLGREGGCYANDAAACGPPYPGALWLPKQTIPQNSRLETGAVIAASAAAESQQRCQEELGQGVQTPSAPPPHPVSTSGKGVVAWAPPWSRGGR